MASLYLRRALHSAATWLAKRTDPSPWRVRSLAIDEMAERRRPMVFPDTDTLEMFLMAVGATTVGVRGGSSTLVVPPYQDAVDAIAHAARWDRTSIIIGGSTPVDGFQWFVEFASGRRRMSAKETRRFPHIHVAGKGDAPVEMVAVLMREVDRFGQEVRWLRAGTPVVSPVSMEEGLQREHDSKVSRRAARVGGWWGAVGGGLIALVAELLRR